MKGVASPPQTLRLPMHARRSRAASYGDKRVSITKSRQGMKSRAFIRVAERQASPFLGPLERMSFLARRVSRSSARRAQCGRDPQCHRRTAGRVAGTSGSCARALGPSRHVTAMPPDGGGLPRCAIAMPSDGRAFPRGGNGALPRGERFISAGTGPSRRAARFISAGPGAYRTVERFSAMRSNALRRSVGFSEAGAGASRRGAPSLATGARCRRGGERFLGVTSGPSARGCRVGSKAFASPADAHGVNNGIYGMSSIHSAFRDDPFRPLATPSHGHLVTSFLRRRASSAIAEPCISPSLAMRPPRVSFIEILLECAWHRGVTPGVAVDEGRIGHEACFIAVEKGVAVRGASVLAHAEEGIAKEPGCKADAMGFNAKASKPLSVLRRPENVRDGAPGEACRAHERERQRLNELLEAILGRGPCSGLVSARSQEGYRCAGSLCY